MRRPEVQIGNPDDRRFRCLFSACAFCACLVIVALVALDVPTVYIRKTNKILKLLEEIATNTRK